MTDDIADRLRETADECLESYKKWRKGEKDRTARQTLNDAVHELRKVAARLEIEMAVSQEGVNRSKPLPIPSHRAKKGNTDADDDSRGNQDDNPNKGKSSGKSKRTANKKS